jgi:hypothetical protein
MGRLNWIWQALWTLSLFVGVFGAPTPLLAVTGPEVNKIETLGTCNIHLLNESATNRSHIGIAAGTGNAPNTAADGAVLWNGNIINVVSFGPTNIAKCLGTASANITNVIQDGADASFGVDTLIAFKFTVTNNIPDSLQAGEYGYKIGTETFHIAGPAPDTTLPVVTVPENIEVNAAAGSASAIVDFTAPSATDAVGVTITQFVSSPTAGLVSGSSFPIGVTTLTYTATDAAGNVGTASFTVKVNFTAPPDTTPPVVTVPENIAVNAAAGSNTATVDFTAPTAIDAVYGPITPVLVSSPTEGLDNGSSFPIGVTTLTYTATDAVGNVATASFTVTVSDSEAPVVTVPENIAVNAAAGSDTAIVDFTAPTAIDAVDGPITPVLVSSPTAGLDSGSAFPIGVTTLTYTATDAVGNVGTASFTVTVSDVTPPVEATEMTITTNPDGSITVNGMAEPGATVVVTFPDGSEFTFLNGDIVRTIPPKISDLIKAMRSRNRQGTTNKAADNSSAFSITSAPAQPSGGVQVVVIDASGNSSEASTTGFVAGPTPEQTQEQIAGYMQNRASQTIASQPDLIGLLSGASTGSFNAYVTQSNGNFDLVTSGDQPVWATLQGSWAEFGTTESSYFFGAVGAHTQVSPDALVGIMLEFDKLSQSDGASSSEGDGYLVGPYFVAKLPNHPLLIEGRLLTGQTENQVSVVGVGGTATETFDTQRTLASIKVAGQLNYGELVLTPSLTATHLRDAQDAFANTRGNIVAAQGIEVSSVAAGLNFAQPVSLSNGELMLTGGISSFWSSSRETGIAATDAAVTEGPRGRVSLGASYTLPNGVVLSTGAFYDGIGLNDYESYGLDLEVQMQF